MSSLDNDKVFGRKEKYFRFNTSSLASYFLLILSFFATLQFAYNLSVSATTTASISIIFLFVLFLLSKL